MKKRLSLFCFTLAILAVAAISEAQIGQPYSPAGNFGGQVYEPGAFQATGGDLALGLPGRIWIRSNYADRGLGYENSYVTLGAKNRLFQDAFDGRWLGEARVHYTLEDGGDFFGNFGIERVFTLDSAGADVSLGFFVDHDRDNISSFAEAATQLSVAAKIKTRRWDLLGNGYFNVGTSDYSAGDPTGANCFYQNHIVLQPGIDSSLQGFDATLRMRPEALGMVNGTFDIGGYGYSSELINYFGGGRVRMGMQLLRGLIVNAEVNYDDRFDVTGVLSAGWYFGVNARGNEYAGLGRDLEETVRNDHIVKYRQDLVLAIDPDTGLPYDVYHVNNLADPAFSFGTAENPFATLAEAEAASAVGDIIFVNPGNGTAFNQNMGIVLKDDQLLLGGGRHLIPVQGGQLFELCNDQTAPFPVITGANNGPAVTLANNNVVRGFNISGAASATGMGYGIYGNGVDGATIENNIISGAVLDGVRITGGTGDFTFDGNTIAGNSRDGVLLDNLNANNVSFVNNAINSNSRDGIHLVNYDAAVLDFLANVTNNNQRHGVHLENAAGTGMDVDFNTHTSSGNNGDGIRVDTGDGDLTLVNTTSSNNGLNGLSVLEWTGDINIGTTGLGSSNFVNNTAGYGIYNELAAGNQTFNVTDTASSGNLNGLGVRTTGLTANVATNIIDNVGFNNNVADGLRFFAENGSSQTVTIDQTGLTNLPISGNGGIGINFQSGNASAGSIASIQATVNNVNVTGNNTGVNISAIDDGEATVSIADSTISNNAADGITMSVGTSNSGALNRLIVDNVNLAANGDDAIELTTQPGSKTDLVVLNSALAGGAGSGIDVTATGSGGIAGVDNRTRMVVRGSTVNGFAGSGISAITNSDASLLADIRGNTVSGNGSGIDMTSNDISLISFNLIGNSVANNAAPGTNITTNGTSAINAFWENNGFTGNGAAGATATNAATSTICIALSSNFFDNGFVATNNSAVADFVVELDGLSNGFGAGALPANVTVLPFGTLCQPSIAAEEAAFGAAGFPNIN